MRWPRSASPTSCKSSLARCTASAARRKTVFWPSRSWSSSSGTCEGGAELESLIDVDAAVHLRHSCGAKKRRRSEDSPCDEPMVAGDSGSDFEWDEVIAAG